MYHIYSEFELAPLQQLVKESQIGKNFEVHYDTWTIDKYIEDYNKLPQNGFHVLVALASNSTLTDVCLTFYFQLSTRRCFVYNSQTKLKTEIKFLGHFQSTNFYHNIQKVPLSCFDGIGQLYMR